MHEIELNEKDLDVAIYMGAAANDLDLDAYLAALTGAPIRITHIPTGIVTIGEGQGSQLKNHEMAIELLKKQLLKISGE